MSVVPRLLEKVFNKINAKGSELTGVKKVLIFLGYQARRTI
jgi:long-chain acyl-CoA synthetase